MYETGGMRRTHLRHQDNIAKRLLIHASAFNLGLVMRKMTGGGTPRGLQGRINQILLLVLLPVSAFIHAITSGSHRSRPRSVTSRKIVTSFRLAHPWPDFRPPVFQN
jgi:hypothetical protein